MKKQQKKTNNKNKKLINNSNSKWFKTEQIETFVGNMNEKSELIGERKKLIVMHECGKDKGALIEQLKTMISGLETNFECFAN